jgi:uncharacterized protein YbjT (DUF2867 family)
VQLKLNYIIFTKKMKILISGATGLVGNVLIQEALLKGNEIHFLTRNKTKLGSHDGVTAFYLNPSKNEN